MAVRLPPGCRNRVFTDRPFIGRKARAALLAR